MKQWNDDLSTHYGWTTTRLAMYWRVNRSDGETFGWVDHDRDVTVGSLTYRSAFGLRPTATQTTMDLKPGTMDVTSFLDVSTEEEIEAGVWDEADIFVFEAPWDTPPHAADAVSVNILLAGRLGQIGRRSGVFTAQLHGMLERLDNVIGEVYTPTCPWRLGDPRCTVDLAPHTHQGSITEIGSEGRFEFLDANSGQPAGFYNEGTITFTSGRNTGYTQDVREWTGTTFRLHRPIPFAVQVGDAYTAVRGDDKRLETCRDVFNNVRHFRGFPDIPGQDVVLDNPLAVQLGGEQPGGFPPIEEGGEDIGGDGGASGGDSGETGGSGEGEGPGESGEGGGTGGSGGEAGEGEV